MAVFQKNWVGMFGPLPNAHTLRTTKIRDFLRYLLMI